MNDRIRELAKQAGMTDDKFGMFFALDKHNEDGVDLEKFAELLIKESIGVVNKRYMGDNNREDFEVRRCVEDLKNHFGVE